MENVLTSSSCVKRIPINGAATTTLSKAADVFSTRLGPEGVVQVMIKGATIVENCLLCPLEIYRRASRREV